MEKVTLVFLAENDGFVIQSHHISSNTSPQPASTFPVQFYSIDSI